MGQFTIETSLPFPIIKIDSLVTYTKVEKPSGIGFIILVLINEPQFKQLKLSDLLVQFGVPNDLHGLFADELQRMIDELEIIVCQFKYSKEYFSEYKLHIFSFTEKGKKVFKEEVIPSDLPIEDRIEVYFNPAQNQLFYQTKDIKLSSIENSALPEDFVKQFNYTDEISLEDYLNSIKGIGIKIKKEELITKVVIAKNNHYYTKYDVSLVFKTEKSSLDFKFKEKPFHFFFNKFYNPKIIEESLLFKTKFKILGPINKIKSIDIENASWMTLDQYPTILSKKSLFILTKGNYMPSESAFVLVQKNLVDTIDDSIETIHFVNKAEVLGYSPVQTVWNIEKIQGTIEIPLLCERPLIEDEVNYLLDAIPSTPNDYSVSYVRSLINFLTNMEKIQLLEEKLTNFLETELNSRMSRLKEIKTTQVISSIKKWLTFQIKQCFDEYFISIPLDQLDLIVENGKWMTQFLETPQSVIIQRVVSSNPKVKKEELFMKLETNGFLIKEIFQEINIFGTLLDNVLHFKSVPINGVFSQTLESLRQSLVDLMTLTEITQPTQVIIKENLDSSLFMGVYHGFIKLIEELSELKKFAPREFEILEQYRINFGYIQDKIREEHKAESNPKNIDMKAILNKIQKKEFFSAMILMSAKLEWVLSNHYNLKGSLESSIDKLSEIEELEPFVKSLHEFRIARNQTIHPGKVDPNLNVDQLKRWATIIFEEVNIK